MAVWRRANLNWTSWWFSTAPRRSAGCVRCCRRPVRWALSTRWPQRWMPKMLAVDAVEENKWLEHVRTNDWLLNFHPQWTMIFKGKHMMLRLSRLNHFSFGLAFVLVQAKGHTNGSGLNCGFESRSHYGGTESNWNKIMVGFSNNQELHTHIISEVQPPELGAHLDIISGAQLWARHPWIKPVTGSAGSPRDAKMALDEWNYHLVSSGYLI